MRRDGLTLLEMLITVGIVTALFLAAVPSFWNFLNTYQMDALANDLAQVLRLAQQKSMSGEADDVWSVHLVSGSGGSFTLYRGSTYASRDTNYDEVHDLPSSLTLTYTVPDADITFVKIEGTTTDTGDVTITWPGSGEFWTVNVNEVGRVDFQ
jgi:Tfp pilus assembly protein FimT